MACKKVQLRGEEHKHRNDVVEAIESAVTDALLFATMCIVGMCVDVHTKDGSVFSGMFYTASIEKDYAIVLKNASMTKKGNREGNVADGTLLETLIIRSEDLVQVVAKGVQLPSNGISGYVGGDRAEISLHYRKSSKNNESSWNGKHKGENRLYSKKEDSSPSSPTSKTVNAKVDGRQVQNDFQKRQGDSKEAHNNLEVKDETQEVQDLYLSKEATVKHAREIPASTGTPHSTVGTPAISVPTLTNADVNSESRLGVSPKPYMLSPKKGSGYEKNAKESKLNPGAKIFSPSIFNKRMSTPIVPSGTNFPYMPGTYTMAPLVSAQDVDESSFSHSPVPVKFVPRNNLASANVGYGASYAQPMIGQLVNRSQQVRYANLYQQIPPAPAYSQQSPQNVMMGLAEPVFSFHPITGDIVPSAAGFSPDSLRLPLTMHQTHPPKNQGNISHQAMNQLPIAPQIMASPPQSLVLPNSVPLSPPVYPILNPTIAPGSNNYLSTKLV